jgi:5'-3' exonuclease
MGIPSYFYTLTKQYTDIITSKRIVCDRLFLDYNGIIHTACGVLRSEIPKTTPIDEFEDTLVEKIIEYTNKIIVTMNPSSLVYLSVDGVAPMAKIKQQRKRRFVSAYIKTQLPVDIYEWDTNAISPGTLFMNRLDKRMKEVYDSDNNNNMYDIIVSGHEIPGEGEYKIFAHIKSKPNLLVDVVYGLDADLIMLGLISPSENMYLLREPQHFNNTRNTKSEFLLFDVNLLRNSLLKNYNNKIDVCSYVCMCILLGNDFLPNLSYINIKRNGIDVLSDIYMRVSKNTDMKLVDMDNEGKYCINIIFLLHMFEELSINEGTHLEACHKQYYEREISYKSDKLLLDNYGITNKCTKPIDMFVVTNWRTNYYSYLFSSNTDIVSKTSKNYIDGILWNFEYYFNKKTCNEWFYKYEYSPTILDIYNHIVSGYIGNSSPNTHCGDVTTDEQLLMILPPQSFHLVKDKLKSALEFDSGICHMYPLKFHIMTYQKTKLHECHPILPNIDIYGVRKFVNSIL